MRLRGDITYAALEGQSNPELDMDSSPDLPCDERWLCHDTENFSPANAGSLEIIRAHCIDYPQGILLDVYQDLTELGLRHPSGTLEAQGRYLNGLRSETAELHHELMVAQLEHPYADILQSTNEFEDFWLGTVLDTNRLRFPHLSPERKQHYLSEMGDVLWYVARVGQEADIPLSNAVLDFLLDIDAGKLQTYLEHGDKSSFEKRFAETMDFDLFQTIALNVSDKVWSDMNADTPRASRATIENMPAQLFGHICEDGLWPDKGIAEDWDPAVPYRHLPDLKLTLGKITWFVAYTAHSLLNTDFRTVMQANLKKMVLRTQQGTLFEKDQSSRADGAAANHGSQRMPFTLE